MSERTNLKVVQGNLVGECETFEASLSSRRANRLLVVDDDRVLRELLKGIFEREGYGVWVASSGEQALQLFAKENFPIILSDINMLEVDGHALLSHLNKSGSDSVVILMTGFGSLEGAMEAIHHGAFDYISKPFKPEEMLALVGRAARHWETTHSEIKGPVVDETSHVRRTIIGKAPRIVQVYKVMAKAALASSNILVTGESGTGKELVAKAIHDNSARRSRAFVTVNCGALTETLLESELFGHVKGSFTGSISNKRGLFDEADGGTIFLDEIGDITPALQVKLLRVIQEGEFKPVGSTEVRRVDARVIAATHRDLDLLVREGKFREDLYYRLKVILIDLPPLRDRIEDLSELAYFFLARYSNRAARRVTTVSKEAMALLYAYPWPGNIRELEHAIERATAMTNTTILYPEDFPPEIVSFSGSPSASGELPPMAKLPAELPQSLEQMERAHIVRILQEVSFNKSKAADILGIDRATLYRKAQRYGIRLVDDRG